VADESRVQLECEEQRRATRVSRPPEIKRAAAAAAAAAKKISRDACRQLIAFSSEAEAASRLSGYSNEA
jgi:hypothetical protein